MIGRTDQYAGHTVSLFVASFIDRSAGFEVNWDLIRINVHNNNIVNMVQADYEEV